MSISRNVQLLMNSKIRYIDIDTDIDTLYWHWRIYSGVWCTSACYNMHELWKYTLSETYYFRMTIFVGCVDWCYLTNRNRSIWGFLKDFVKDNMLDVFLMEMRLLLREQNVCKGIISDFHTLSVAW